MLYNIGQYDRIDVGYSYSHVIISPDGAYTVATPSDATSRTSVTLINNTNYSLINVTCPSYIPTTAVAFSHDSSTLYVGSANTGTILVFKKVSGTWGYVSSIVSTDTTAIIHSIAVGADDIDIVWVEGENIAQVYNTISQSYYTGSGQLATSVNAFRFDRAVSPAKSPVNYFIFSRNSPSTGQQNITALSKYNGVYKKTTAPSVIANIDNISVSEDGTFAIPSLIKTSTATNFTLIRNQDIVTNTFGLATTSGGTIGTFLDDVTYIIGPRTSMSTLSVYSFYNVPATPVLQYNLNTQFTTVGQLQYANGILINFLKLNDNFIEFHKIIKTNYFDNLKIDRKNTMDQYLRQFRSNGLAVSENGKKYIMINNNATVISGDIVDGNLITNTISAQVSAGGGNNVANNLAISPDGRYGYFVNGTTLRQFNLSLNTGLFAAASGTAALGTATSRGMAINPDSNMIAVTDANSLKVFNITETGPVAITVSGTFVDTDVVWFSNTEFYGVSSNQISFYRVSGSTVTRIGTRTGLANLTGLSISNDKRKLAAMRSGSLLNGVPLFFNIDPSDFTNLGTPYTATTATSWNTGTYFGAFNNDGTLFIAASSTGVLNNLHLLDVETIGTGTISVLSSISTGYTHNRGQYWSGDTIKTLAFSSVNPVLEYKLINGTLTNTTNFKPGATVPGGSTLSKISPDASYIIRPATVANGTAIFNSIEDGSFTEPAVFRNDTSGAVIFSNDSKYMMIPSNAALNSVTFYEKESNNNTPVEKQSFTDLGWVNASNNASTIGDYSTSTSFFAVAYGGTVLLFRNNHDGTFTNFTDTVSGIENTYNGCTFDNTGTLLYVYSLTASRPVVIFKFNGTTYVRDSNTLSANINGIKFSPSGSYAAITYNGSPFMSINSVGSDGKINEVVSGAPIGFATTAIWITENLLYASFNTATVLYGSFLEFDPSRGILTIKGELRPISQYSTQKTNISIGGKSQTERYLFTANPTDNNGGGDTTLNLGNTYVLQKIVDTSTSISGETVLNSIFTDGVLDTSIVIDSDSIINSLTTDGEIDAPMAVYGDVQIPSPFVVDGFIGDDSSSAITTVTLSSAFIDLNGYNYELSYTALPQPYAYGKTRFGSISSIGQLYIDNELYGDTLIPMFVVVGEMNLPPQFEGNVLINSIISEGELYEEQFLIGEMFINSISSIGALSQGETFEIGIILPSFEISGEFLLEPEIYGEVLISSIETDGLFAVPQNASGDVIIPSIITEGRLSDGEEITGEVLISSIETTGYVTSGENISGETFIPIIIANGEMITDLAIDSDTVFGPMLSNGTLVSGDFVTGDVNIPSIVTEIVSEVFFPGEITGDTLINKISTEGIIGQEGALSGDVVIGKIITDGMLTRQIDIDGSIILNSIETAIIAEARLQVSGNVTINRIITSGELKKLAARRRFLNIV